MLKLDVLFHRCTSVLSANTDIQNLIQISFLHKSFQNILILHMPDFLLYILQQQLWLSDNFDEIWGGSSTVPHLLIVKITQIPEHNRIRKSLQSLHLHYLHRGCSAERKQPSELLRLPVYEPAFQLQSET